MFFIYCKSVVYLNILIVAVTISYLDGMVSLLAISAVRVPVPWDVQTILTITLAILCFTT